MENEKAPYNWKVYLVIAAFLIPMIILGVLQFQKASNGTILQFAPSLSEEVIGYHMYYEIVEAEVTFNSPFNRFDEIVDGFFINPHKR